MDHHVHQVGLQALAHGESGQLSLLLVALDLDHQMRLDPGGQLLRREGLGDVVLRAELEGAQAVVHLLSLGQEDDGDMRRLRERAQAAAGLEAVAVGQVDVQHEQVRGALGEGAFEPAETLHAAHPEPGPGQRGRDDPDDGGIVFQEQHLPSGSRPRLRRRDHGRSRPGSGSMSARTSLMSWRLAGFWRKATSCASGILARISSRGTAV